jgi:hypothetical protein
MKSLKQTILESINEAKFDHGRWNGSSKLAKLFKKIFNKHGKDFDIPAVVVSRPILRVDNSGMDRQQRLTGDDLFNDANGLFDEIKDYIEVVYKAFITREEEANWDLDPNTKCYDVYYSFDADGLENGFDGVKEDIKDKFVELCKKYCPEAKIDDEMNLYDNWGRVSIELSEFGYYMYPSIEFCW